MLVLAIKRESANLEKWFLAPLVPTFRRVQIAHYKPNPTGGMDDILQLEHTGVYQLIHNVPSGNFIYDAFTFIAGVQDNAIGLGNVSDLVTYLSNSNRVVNLYGHYTNIYPLLLSLGRADIQSNGSVLSSITHDGWFASISDSPILFSKMVYHFAGQNLSGTLQYVKTALIALPDDATKLAILVLWHDGTNHRIASIYDVVIDNSSYTGTSTINVHIFIGDVESVRVTQPSLYNANTYGKQYTRHIYPPTVHGYGTTIIFGQNKNLLNDVNEMNDTSEALDRLSVFYDCQYT